MIESNDRPDILRSSGVTNERIVRVVQDAINAQRIIILPYNRQAPAYAGGTNMCPNSDFAYSHKAATVENTLPSDPAASNNAIYRVYRQAQGANIVENETTFEGHVKATEADAWVPNWDKVQGVVNLGWDGGSGSNYDIAFKLNNNWLKGNTTWYFRAAAAINGTDPVPSGTKLYAGFWVKRIGGSQGWVQGGQFVLDGTVIGTPGTRTFNYKVIALTDSGATLESQVLSIANAPNAFTQNDYIRIFYSGASGFIEFRLYRQDPISGEVHLIARDRNSNQLYAYDIGTNINPEPGFPTVTTDQFRAYAEGLLDAVPITVQKTFNNMTIRIPPNFDTSDVDAQGTYLRIGLVDEVTENRQIQLDTIWLSESFNVWSPSPFDDYPSAPSTTMTSAPPTGGNTPTNEPPPTGGGNSCVELSTDTMADGEWTTIGELGPTSRMSNGTGTPNTIRQFLEADVSQYFVIEFSNGVKVRCTASHRFARAMDDNTCLLAEYINVGDSVMAGGPGGDTATVVVKILVSGTFLKVRSPQFTDGSPNKLYVVGDRSTGNYVYSHNNKPITPSELPPVGGPEV